MLFSAGDSHYLHLPTLLFPTHFQVELVGIDCVTLSAQSVPRKLVEVVKKKAIFSCLKQVIMHLLHKHLMPKIKYMPRLKLHRCEQTCHSIISTSRRNGKQYREGCVPLSLPALILDVECWEAGDSLQPLHSFHRPILLHSNDS